MAFCKINFTIFLAVLVTVWPYHLTLVINQIGHYPPSYCQVTDVVLHTITSRFSYHSEDDDVHSTCDGVTEIWPLTTMEPLLFNICDQTFDVGHAFTVFYYYGSNYFHLHYDMLIPLYAAVYYHSTGKNPAGTQAFMPSVETKRLQEVDWSTTAFTDTSKYWVQMVKMITGDHTYMPLDQTTRNFGERICFSTVNFGTPRVDFSDQNLIRSFVAHVQRMLNVTVNVDVPPRVGVISRANRRRLLNEDELVAAISTLAPVDKIEFSRMSFHDQVALMQHYTVLIGMNGAGLTNGLYLPPGGVTIQLVPAGLDLNVRQFGELLRSGAGGGYMEWHSGAAEEGISGIVGDTVVDVQELVAMTRKALQLQQQHQGMIVDEL